MKHHKGITIMGRQGQVIDSIFSKSSYSPIYSHVPSSRLVGSYAQLFTGNGFKITLAQFFLARNGLTSVDVFLSARIYKVDSNNSNLPGILLATSTTKVLVNDLPQTSSLSGFVWKDFVFDGNFTAENGVQYYIAIQADNAGLSGVDSVVPWVRVAMYNGSGTYPVYAAYYNGVWVHTATGYSASFVIFGIDGSTFNGGTITQPLEFKHKFLNLYQINESGGPIIPPNDKKFYQTIREWMYANRNDVPGGPASDSLGIRFAEENGGEWTNIYGGVTKMSATSADQKAPGMAVNDHLWVRRDFSVRGFMKSYEGNIVLHGNGLDAVKPVPGQPEQPGNDKWNVGWGPRVGTPFIWLAEGGHYKQLYDIGGNPEASTLIIATNSDGHTYDNIDSFYAYGHVECNDVVSHGSVRTAYLRSLSGIGSAGSIILYNNLVPYSNETLDLGASNLRFRDLYCRHGNFGDVRAPEGVVAEDIYSPTRPNSYIHYRSTGNMITLGGNVTITGTLNTPNSLRSGTKTTGSDGTLNVTFDQAFPTGHVPNVVVTAFDATGRNITAVVTQKSNTGFTVKTMLATGNHIHQVGNAENTSSFNMGTGTTGSNHSHTV